jgi:hypothetical protein
VIPQRLFTVDYRVILSSVEKVQAAKLDEVLVKVRELFNDYEMTFRYPMTTHRCNL